MDEQKKTSGSLALNGAPQVITIPPSDPVRDRKLRVAAYARVSSGSEDQLNSFAAQNAHYTELITDNPEWEFVDVYADKGITGTSAEKRDDFQRLLADCRRGRVDKILVKSSSRFARNAKECLEAVRELKALGVGVCFEEQGIDTSELAGELLTAIFAMMDQKESENISDNIRWSIQKRMARGTFVPSSLPFGYKKDEDGGIIIDSGRAKYVRQIFSDFLKGYNMQEIAGHMKERQSVDPVLSPYQWKVKSIARILKNEKYAGNSLWQKSFRTPTLPRRSLTNRGELNQYYAPNTHPAIIDQTVFDKVQSLLREREQHYFSKAKRSTPISGMLRCGHCGALFRKQINSGIIYFICRTHTVDLAECPIGPIPERTIYDAFLRLYHKLRNQGMPILKQLSADLQSARKGKLLWSLDIVALNQKIADITRQDRLLAQLKQQGLVDPDIFISRQNELAEQLRAAKLEKERFLEAEEDQTIQQTQELIEALEAGPDFLDTFDGELFRELVDKIIVESNDRVQVRRQERTTPCKKSPAQKELRKLCGGSPPAWVERQVLGLLNRLIQHPERITCPVLEDEPPPEVKKLRRGLDELLHRPPVDEVQTRDLAFRLADLQLNAIGPEEYETLRLRRLFQGWAPMAELEQELLHQSVRRIAVSNGTVTVLLKNNQTLEGGHYT